jgi:ABC-type tungstate transport system substrate-binding protein
VIGRGALLIAFLAAFGRAIAEVGAIIIVGGNIRGYTRTMITAIATWRLSLRPHTKAWWLRTQF